MSESLQAVIFFIAGILLKDWIRCCVKVYKLKRECRQIQREIMESGKMDLDDIRRILGENQC